MRGGPRGVAKDVVKSQTVVYHFTPEELRKRLRLPAAATFSVDIAGVEIAGGTATGPLGTLHVEVKS